jgi:hypothetical protein
MKKYLGLTIMLVALVLAVIFVVLGFIINGSFRFIGNTDNTNQASITQELTDFTELKINATGDIEIMQTDNIESVTVIGTDDFVKAINVKQTGNSVSVAGNENFKFQLFNLDFFAGNKIIVRVKSLDKIESNGTGSLSINSFATDNLKLITQGTGDCDLGKISIRSLNISLKGTGDFYLDKLSGNEAINILKEGTGDIEIIGQTKDLTITSKGMGNVNAEELIATNANIFHTGTGDIRLKVIENLSITKSGLGDINYFGNPKTQIKNTGLGSINHKD